MKRRFIIFGVLGILLFVVDLWVGSLRLDFSGLWNGGELDPLTRSILVDFRIPKAVVAVLAGVALSVSGLLMQTIFRNPLAGPYTLGVSSGAGLGVAVYMLGTGAFGFSFGFVQELGVAFAAWVGAGAVLFVIMGVSARIKDIMAVLILGMMLGSAASAFVNVLQFFSSDAALKGFVLWSMGSLSALSGGQLWVLLGSVGCGVLGALLLVKKLNLLLMGEHYARTMGLNVRMVRFVVFGVTSLLAGSVTAFCGPIAFLGTAVPHVARMIFRTADHRVLMPGSILLGADLMLLCDILAGVPFSELVLPINTVTALFGIPVVVMVVINSGRGRMM